jgi:hypothetical protein
LWNSTLLNSPKGQGCNRSSVHSVDPFSELHRYTTNELLGCYRVIVSPRTSRAFGIDVVWDGVAEIPQLGYALLSLVRQRANTLAAAIQATSRNRLLIVQPN